MRVIIAAIMRYIDIISILYIRSMLFSFALDFDSSPYIFCNVLLGFLILLYFLSPPSSSAMIL